MITVKCDTHHPVWFKTPVAKFIPKDQREDPGKIWDTPEAPGVNRMAELDVIAAIESGHSRCVYSEVEYDHETKRRVCALKFEGLSDTEIAALRGLSGIEVIAE